MTSSVRTIGKAHQGERVGEDILLLTDQIHLLYEQLGSAIAFHLITGLVLVAILWSSSPHYILVSWYLTLIVFSGIRGGLLFRYRHSSIRQGQNRSWLLWFVITTVLIGLLWSILGIVLFPFHSVIHTAIVILWICGLSSGGVASLSVIKGVFSAFSASALLPLCVYLLFQGSSPGYLFAIAMIMFFCFLTLISIQMHKTLMHNLRLKHENIRLIGSLSREKERVEGINQELEERIIKRTSDLLKINAELSQEIKRRESTEGALRKSEEKFSRAFHTLPDALVISKLKNGQILYMNPASITLTGYSTEDVLGKSAANLNLWVYPSEREELVQALENTDSLKNYETIFRKKNGETFPVAITVSTLEIDGEICMLSIVHDLTEAKQAEEERKRLEQQLFRSQKMEAIGQLTGGIAHDFNNILTSILGYANLALKKIMDKDDSKLGDFLEQIKYGGERAREMTKQMLMYSKALPSEASHQSLQPMVENAIRLLRPMLPSNIEIHTEITEGLPEAKVDPTQFEQIIINLCINARDAIEGNGSITIGLSASNITNEICDSCHRLIFGKFIALTVKDSGIGIADDIKSKIFDPFYTTKEVGRGTGMGLSMVHGIIHNCGGHILMDSIPGKGTTFTTLFEKSDALELNSDIKREVVQESESNIEPCSGVIMIVDDEFPVANYLGEFLGLHGHEVIVYNNAEKALGTLRQQSSGIDLIITDQTMPGMTGIELANEVLELYPEMPILLISGYSETVNEAIAKKAGIKAYLKKPLNEEILLEKVCQILSMK